MNPKLDLKTSTSSVLIKVLIFLACGWVPTQYLIKEYQARPDLTQLVFFGKSFQSRALPEIQALKPLTDSEFGYDGQFYAQLALDPLLTRPETPRTMDDPSIRAPRIFLPFLAHLLGTGKPAATVRFYVLLNLFFWYLLLGILLGCFPTHTWRGFFVVCAIVFSTGTLLSIQRALTDLPSSTLGLMGLITGEAASSVILGLAILTRPTSLLFLLRYACPRPLTTAALSRKGTYVLIALALPLLWQIYLTYQIHAKLETGGNIGLPFAEWSRHVVLIWKQLATVPFGLNFPDGTPWEFNLFEFLAIASLTFQAVFIFSHPQWNKPVWLVGAAFAVLYFCLTQKVMVDQISFTRAVLPMTISFNLILLQARPVLFFILCFFAGNIGLFLAFDSMLDFIFN
jgi:hypothetical protein